MTHRLGDLAVRRPLEVPAHGTVAVATGRRRPMLASARPGLREGSTVHLTLVSAVAGSITVPVTVTPVGSRG